MDYSKPASAKDFLRGDSSERIAVPKKKSILVVGSTVVLCPDADSQAKDRESKYFLGLNIGRVEAINHDLHSVELWWYWGTGWSDPNWILWRAPKTKQAYKEWVGIEDLVCDEFDHIVRINMESVAKRFKQDKFKMAKESIKDIKRCLQANKDMLTCLSEDLMSAAEDSDQQVQSDHSE